MKVRRYFARRAGVLVITVVVAVSIAHVFLAWTVEGYRLTTAIRGTPGYLVDGFIRGDFGQTFGGGCPPAVPPEPRIKLCASYPPGQIDDLLRERVPVDLQLLLGGMVLGTLAGVWGGRRCATRPDSLSARALHVATALMLSCPPYFLAFLFLIYFADGSGTVFQIPFSSGVTDYRPFSDDPLAFLKAMWVPWVLCALPLAAYVLRITDNTLREVLQEDFVRTARAKGLAPGPVANRHALPLVTPAISVMTGVNVSTMLLNVAVIEYGFGIPGLFRTIHAASLHGDVPVIMALVIEGVLLITIANFLADAVQQMLDPRVRSAV
ncbi:MAG TPA: ABC transporter permease [Solirubrobacter sp.]|nr:ABC transporter permease [Solirubrobacter sp.]